MFILFLKVESYHYNLFQMQDGWNGSDLIFQLL